MKNELYCTHLTKKWNQTQKGMVFRFYFGNETSLVFFSNYNRRAENITEIKMKKSIS